MEVSGGVGGILAFGWSRHPKDDAVAAVALKLRGNMAADLLGQLLVGSRFGGYVPDPYRVVIARGDDTATISDRPPKSDPLTKVSPARSKPRSSLTLEV